MKLIKSRISLNNLCIQHHLETFTSASEFRHGILPSTLSSDDVTRRKKAELDKPRLLRKTDDK